MPVKSGGGWHAVRYSLRVGKKVGWRALLRTLRSKNACKTCAVGMGGQAGGMHNEVGRWPEVCKKSLQALAADMQGAIKPEFFEKFNLEQLASLSPRELESAGRLTQPMFAGIDDTHYRPVSWNWALDKVAEKLRATKPDESFFYFSGRSSNEAGFLLQLFARIYGTNNINNCSFFCHQASGVGLTRSLGSGTATVTLEDVERADLFFLIGGNPASNHPRLMRTMMDIRRSGGQVVVVNPLIETGLVNFRIPSDVRSLLFGSKIASHYLQVHIGGDVALLTGLAKATLARGDFDKQFIETATQGFDDFVRHVDLVTWSDIVADCGIEQTKIAEISDLYGRAKNVVFGWTMGITHHEHGVQNVQAIVNLALLRGMLGRPNAGLLPIRGHSNVQGIGSMGVTPALKQAVFDRLQAHFGIQLPTTPGMDTLSCMEAADRGDIRFGWCLGGNLFGSCPDAKWAEMALSKVDLLVYLNMTLNTGHTCGLGKETLMLPVLARDEESQATTQESMFNFVRLSDGGIARLEGPRSEIAVIADVADRCLGNAGPVDWRQMHEHRSIRSAIAKIVPGYEKVGDIDASKQEFHVEGRVFHQARFPTPSGKAAFQFGPLPRSTRPPGALRLMTIRSEGQFNTVVYEEEDIYRGQDRRDAVLMSRDDIERFGFRQNERVVVRSAVGFMEGLLVREAKIKPGNAAMYYPEANILVPAKVDPHSRTPAFKSIWVTVEKERHSPLAILPN